MKFGTGIVIISKVVENLLKNEKPTMAADFAKYNNSKTLFSYPNNNGKERLHVFPDTTQAIAAARLMFPKQDDKNAPMPNEIGLARVMIHNLPSNAHVHQTKIAHIADGMEREAQAAILEGSQMGFNKEVAALIRNNAASINYHLYPVGLLSFKKENLEQWCLTNGISAHPDYQKQIRTITIPHSGC